MTLTINNTNGSTEYISNASYELVRRYALDAGCKANDCNGHRKNHRVSLTIDNNENATAFLSTLVLSDERYAEFVASGNWKEVYCYHPDFFTTYVNGKEIVSENGFLTIDGRETRMFLHYAEDGRAVIEWSRMRRFRQEIVDEVVYGNNIYEVIENALKSPYFETSYKHKTT